MWKRDLWKRHTDSLAYLMTYIICKDTCISAKTVNYLKRETHICEKTHMIDTDVLVGIPGWPIYLQRHLYIGNERRIYVKKRPIQDTDKLAGKPGCRQARVHLLQNGLPAQLACHEHKREKQKRITWAGDIVSVWWDLYVGMSQSYVYMHTQSCVCAHARAHIMHTHVHASIHTHTHTQSYAYMMYTYIYVYI